MSQHLILNVLGHCLIKLHEKSKYVISIEVKESIKVEAIQIKTYIFYLSI